MVTFRGDDPLKLKCTQIDFGWGSAQDPNGELIALPQTPSWIKKDLLLRGGEGKGGRKKKGRVGGIAPLSEIPNTPLGPRGLPPAKSGPGYN